MVPRRLPGRLLGRVLAARDASRNSAPARRAPGGGTPRRPSGSDFRLRSAMNGPPCTIRLVSRERLSSLLAYIARRLLLMIPTIFGIMLDLLRHRAIRAGRPGRARDRAIAGPRCRRDSRASAAAAADRRGARSRRRRHSSRYRGAQGLDPKFIKELEKQFGFDKPAYERFLMMVRDYATFDFGRSYFRDDAGAAAHQGEAAGLDLARPVDDAALLCDLDPARHPQGGAGRLALRHLDLGRRHRRLCDPELPVRHPADRALLPAARSGRSSRCAA